MRKTGLLRLTEPKYRISIMKSNLNLTSDEAILRLQNICSNREKCTGEIREKLRQWNINKEEAELIIKKLINDKFVDDHRFAGFFVRDKQKLNKWGREKIRYALIHKGIQKEIIEKALESLEVSDYEETLRELLARKSKELYKYESHEKKNRLIRFAVQRGFDYDLISSVINDFISE